MTRGTRTFLMFQGGAASAALDRYQAAFDDYGFSTRFGWVGDPFGVTWQLNLA